MSLLIKHLYQFGQFTVDTDQKVLLRGGKPLPVTPKVFDTLLILVQSPQRIVEKEDLMTKLWPDTFVEDANLTFNIQQLRKCLGDNAVLINDLRQLFGEQFRHNPRVGGDWS